MVPAKDSEVCWGQIVSMHHSNRAYAPFSRYLSGIVPRDIERNLEKWSGVSLRPLQRRGELEPHLLRTLAIRLMSTQLTRLLTYI